MNRKISWYSYTLDEIELVYQKAEENPAIGSLMENLENQALEEAKRNSGSVQLKDGSQLSPEKFDTLSFDTKENIICLFGNSGLSNLQTDMQNGVIVIRLAPVINRVQACTVFNILNRLEKLDGAITVLKPKWTLKLLVPLGGRKGLMQWEMLIMQLYPWLSIQEEATNEVALEVLPEPEEKVQPAEPEMKKQAPEPKAEEKKEPEKKSFWQRLFRH